MPLIVFLRGVNVGGNKSFRPSVLAREMAELDVRSVGAAGTFVVGKKIGQAALRKEFSKRLPFEAEAMICTSRDVEKLVAAQPFAKEKLDKDKKAYVSILASKPKTLPAIPFSRPAGAEWQVKLTGTSGLFVLSLHRRLERTLIYPNEVVEKHFRVSATTRNWNTLEAICEVLNG